MKYRVLILDGSDRQSLPVIRGFHEAGCTACVYCRSRMDMGAVYRDTDEVVLGLGDTADEDATWEDLKAIISRSHYELIVPMVDFYATMLSRHKGEMPEGTIAYVNDWEIYSKAIDKWETMQICQRENIPCPRTVMSLEEAGGLSYPLIVKPRISFGARGLSVVHSEEELNSVVPRTEAKFGPVLIQECIPHTARQFQVEMFMDADGACKGFVLMDKVRWYPLSGGSSTMNVTVHDEAARADCIRLLQTLGWKGYASLDLIEDPRDGKIKIMEINPRMNGTAKICFAMGIDWAKMILQEVHGEEITPAPDYPDGFGLRFFHLDTLWLLKSPNRFKTRPSWFSFKNTIDEIFEWRDLRPALVYTFSAFGKLFTDKKNRSV